MSLCLHDEACLKQTALRSQNSSLCGTNVAVTSICLCTQSWASTATQHRLLWLVPSLAVVVRCVSVIVL